MEAIILAGGLGTRLRSVVNDVPKCMAPVAGRPFLWYLLKHLTKYDVTTVILSVGYLREIIYKWIDEVKNEFPFSFDYAIEKEPLGTGGGIRLALNKAVTDNVLVLNGDTFFNVDIDELMKRHITSRKAVTLALKPMKQFERYGTVDLVNADGMIIAFNEKRYCEEGLINGGVYIINRQTPIFDNIPHKCSFETTVLEPQCKKGALLGVVQNGYFIDIGIPEDYRKANIEFLSLF